MMKRHKQEKLRHTLALTLSIGLHGLLLLGAYYLRMRGALTSQASGYSIELYTQPTQEEAPAEAVQEGPAHPQAEQQATASNQEGETETTPSELPHEAAKGATASGEAEEDQPTSTEQASANPVIDERGLYSINEDKQAGALLELVGWMWDTVPQPKDNTTETGKLIFEIQVDDLGEVIAVRTLEKTVSPLVEQLYKEALAKLTFSKTSESAVYAPISTGKVTFIIQAK